VHEAIPIKITNRITDLVLATGRAPEAVGVAIAGQGSAKGAGIFRSGPKQVLQFCEAYHGKDQPEEVRGCLKETQGRDIAVKADCVNKLVTIWDRTYRLHPMPKPVTDESILRRTAGG
jgi:hypothetical protein